VFINPMSWDVMRDEIGKFYPCRNCVNDYLKQVKYIINRKNIYSNILYKNDATIMAWEIANEPRPMRPSYIEAYKDFIRIIAAEIKNMDSNHLVTTGTEGYIGTENMDVYKSIHADKNIDYLTIHIWPKNWGWYSGNDVGKKMDSILILTDKYIDDHLAVARELNKPLVIEEFGLPRDGNSFDKLSSTNARNIFYNYIFKRWYKKHRRDNYLAGVNFWAYGGLASPVKNQTYWKTGDDYMGDPPMEPQGLYSVFNSDASTWKIIRKFRVKKLNDNRNKPF
ncbi:MAG: cellulase family glycosylhydrolase, partial [Ginsengibacter sp.]